MDADLISASKISGSDKGRDCQHSLSTMAFVSLPGHELKRLPSARTSSSRLSRPRYALSPRMGIRAVESYDGSFKLSEQVDRDLNTLLLGKFNRLHLLQIYSAKPGTDKFAPVPQTRI